MREDDLESFPQEEIQKTRTRDDHPKKSSTWILLQRLNDADRGVDTQEAQRYWKAPTRGPNLEKVAPEKWQSDPNDLKEV